MDHPVGVSQFRSGDKYISPAQAIKLTKILNLSSANVHCREAFTEATEKLLNHTQAFEEVSSVMLFDVLVLEVVDNMLSTKFLSTNPRASYLR